jgi:O-antigen/teichoic acid export membrane protein
VSDVRTNAELAEATASGIRWITLARGGIEILLLASMVLLARLIPPADFGMFAVALIVQELARNIPSEGIGAAIVQRAVIGREHLQAGLAMSLLSGAALTVLTLLLAWAIVVPLYGSDTAWLIVGTTPCFLIGALLALPMSVLRRRLDFRRLSMIDITQSVVRTATTIVLAVAFGLDAAALVIGVLAGAAGALVLALAFCPVPLPRWRTAPARDLLSYGGPAALAAVAWTGFRNGDYAIIGARLGSAQAGFYWRGFQLAVEYQRKVSTIMTQISFPVLSRTAGTEEMYALRRRMVQLLTVTLFPLLVCLVILAPSVVPWIFGPTWEPAVVPTQILAGAGAATVVIDAVGSVLMAQGRSRALLGYGVGHFAVYITAVYVGSFHGLTGVSIAAVAVHGVFLVIAYLVLLRGRGERALRFMWEDMGAAVVSCAVLCAAAVPAESLLSRADAPAVVHLVLVGVVAGVAYLAALRLLFAGAWQDLAALVRRVLPDRPMRAFGRRLSVAAGRGSG